MFYKGPEQVAKGRSVARGSQTFQMQQMPMCVCQKWKKGDSWVSSKSRNSKLQPDGPNLEDGHGTVEHEIRSWKERRVQFSRGLERDSQPEVCEEQQAGTA